MYKNTSRKRGQFFGIIDLLFGIGMYILALACRLFAPVKKIGLYFKTCFPDDTLLACGVTVVLHLFMILCLIFFDIRRKTTTP